MKLQHHLGRREVATAAAKAVASAVGWMAATAVVTAAIVVASCASSAPHAAKALQAEPAPPPKPVDPSYDWHVLVPAPFGSYLKEVPLVLHEVLLFRDDAPGAGKPDDAECYGMDTPAPRFVGGTPDDYLICFKQDRLARIRASVSLSSEKASEIFATACGLWMKNAVANSAPVAPSGATPAQRPPQPPPSATPAANTAVSGSAAPSGAPELPSGAPPGNAPQTRGACEGRDGAVHFSGRLDDAASTTAAPSAAAPNPAAPSGAGASTSLSVVVDGAADPQALSE